MREQGARLGVCPVLASGEGREEAPESRQGSVFPEQPSGAATWTFCIRCEWRTDSQSGATESAHAHKKEARGVKETLRPGEGGVENGEGIAFETSC